MKKLLLAPILLLVAASALLVACSGSSKPDLQSLATEAAGAQPETAVTVTAKNIKFDKKTIVVPAGQEVSLTLDNEDSGTLHNIAIYTDDDDKEEIHRGDLFKGKDQQTYTFTAPAAGVYLFRCDAHPDMNGAFIVK
jgi:plastocyanin